jgi:tRNA dimethylallyltransferase
MGKKPLLLAIVGPTAIGKTETSITVAKYVAGEIISADSMQIYKYMDIGTAKPSAAERHAIAHHLIDIIYPDEEYSVADYKFDAQKSIKDILYRGHQPILTGGTGLYVKSVIDNYYFPDVKVNMELRKRLSSLAYKYGNSILYNRLQEVDPVSATKINIRDTKRIIRALEVYELTKKPISYFEKLTKEQEPEYRLRIYGLNMERQKLYDRINQRVDNMIEKGLVDEVQKLLSMGYNEKLNSMRGLGYKQIVEYINGKVELNDAIENVKRETRRFAKRQLTWFRKDKRIKWIDIGLIDPCEYIIEDYNSIKHTKCL